MNLYFILSHVILATIALLLVLRSKLSTNSQKGFQFLIASILPIIGPVIIIIMMLYMNAKSSPLKRSVGDSAEEHIRKYNWPH